MRCTEIFLTEGGEEQDFAEGMTVHPYDINASSLVCKERFDFFHLEESLPRGFGSEVATRYCHPFQNGLLCLQYNH